MAIVKSKPLSRPSSPRKRVTMSLHKGASSRAALGEESPRLAAEQQWTHYHSPYWWWSQAALPRIDFKRNKDGIPRK